MSERMTSAEFQAIYGHGNQTRSPLPNAKPQRPVAKPLGKTAQGKDCSVGRVVLRIEGFRVKLLDPDNFAGGCKQIIDGLRAAELLLDDTLEHIELQTFQTKVPHFAEERTEITISYP